MASKVVSVLFSIILATILVAVNSANDGINREIQFCVNHTMECNPELSEPCCDSSNICKLINNVFKTNTVRFFCYKTINIGEACGDDDFDCTEDNFARCNSKNICECDNRFTKNNETCEPTLSAYCKEDNHCRVENSNCRDGFCNCKPSYKPNKASTKCLPDFL
ncbi:GSCOCG00008239001-RA-CDS [Cotesia congregata]|uniref:EB domain-containing protein n=1 Tax=Cotesia congregata TaxID=51543 RepID=A0A8J2EBL8_COTCN|nr:GSCOCG00008239001-RA-CDS [Cotesia congregata]CAG5073803.1 Protein of unknown function [Cotesia congregata]